MDPFVRNFSIFHRYKMREMCSPWTLEYMHLRLLKGEALTIQTVCLFVKVLLMILCICVQKKWISGRPGEIFFVHPVDGKQAYFLRRLVTRNAGTCGNDMRFFFATSQLLEVCNARRSWPSRGILHRGIPHVVSFTWCPSQGGITKMVRNKRRTWHDAFV